MKLRDIKVGEDYAVGTDSYASQRTVLEVGVYGQVWYGWSRHTSEHPHYVRVESPSGAEDIVHYRQVIEPWEAYKVKSDRQRAERENKLAEKRRRQHLAEVAPEILEAASILVANALLEPDPTRGYITDCYVVPLDDVDALRAAIAKAKESDR